LPRWAIHRSWVCDCAYGGPAA